MEPLPPPSSLPHNIAIFDIGSNAVRLSITKIDGPHATTIKKETELCEMGRTHDRPGYLYPGGVERAIKTIDHFCKVIRGPQYGCTHMVAVATDAIRRATDGPEFIARLKKTFDIDVRILSEQDEGIFGARGVLNTIPDADGIVADLGGGSLQLTRVYNGVPHETFSLPLGTLRMVAAGETLGDYLDAHLKTIPDNLKTTDVLYVIGGSWRSFAKLYQARSGDKTKDVQGLTLDPDMVRAIHHSFTAKPISDIEESLIRDYHLEKSRSEGVPRATFLLSRLIEMMAPNNIIVSSAGVRDGIIQGIIDGSIVPTTVPSIKAHAGVPPFGSLKPTHDQ